MLIFELGDCVFYPNNSTSISEEASGLILLQKIELDEILANQETTNARLAEALKLIEDKKANFQRMLLNCQEKSTPRTS